MQSSSDKSADFQGGVFDQWLDSIFKHPTTEPEWYLIKEWEMDWAGDPKSFLAQTIRLFQNPEVLPEKYDAKQIEQGFRYLLFWAGGLERWVWAKEIDLELRRTCVISMVTVFERLFTRNSYGDACYMWWDYLRNHEKDPDPEITNVIFEALTQILNIDSIDCRISALHGFGHLRHSRTSETVERFLRSHEELDEETRSYAQAAMKGAIL